MTTDSLRGGSISSDSLHYAALRAVFDLIAHREGAARAEAWAVAFAASFDDWAGDTSLSGDNPDFAALEFLLRSAVGQFGADRTRAWVEDGLLPDLRPASPSVGS